MLICERCDKPATLIWRCDDHHRCDDCGTKDDLCTRTSGLRCASCHEVFIKHRILQFKGSHDYESEAVCPWCGETKSDSWDLYESDETECGECERVFIVERHVEVTYSTTRKESGA